MTQARGPVDVGGAVDESAIDLTRGGSFRDPSGFVYQRDGTVLRQVNRTFADRWTDLNGAGVLATLQREGVLIGHEEESIGLAYAPALAHAVVRPEQLAFVSYPYEWSFSQLKEAALVTLEAQVIAARLGFVLRDASAYNVQLHRGRPILIDTLSFERVRPDTPWRAYRQFCEHFLAPLALMAHRDVRCGLMLRPYLDGIPVDLASTLLPARTRFDVGLGMHIHAHAAAQRRSARSGSNADRPEREWRIGDLRQSALIDNLKRTVEKLNWRANATAWAGYAEATSYSDTASRSKDAIVGRLLSVAGGDVVFDLGANTGRFSAIAAAAGRSVVAWDADPGATDIHYRAVRADGATSIIPLLTNLTNPSPGLGWAHQERQSFVDRSSADVVLALALVHHLLIGGNIRLAMIADLFRRLAPKLIVEFIPETDAMVQRLLRTRHDYRPPPTIDEFRAVFANRFEILDDVPIEDSARRLLLMTRR